MKKIVIKWGSKFENFLGFSEMGGEREREVFPLLGFMLRSALSLYLLPSPQCLALCLSVALIPAGHCVNVFALVFDWMFLVMIDECKCFLL